MCLILANVSTIVSLDINLSMMNSTNYNSIDQDQSSGSTEVYGVGLGSNGYNTSNQQMDFGSIALHLGQWMSIKAYFKLDQGSLAETQHMEGDLVVPTNDEIFQMFLADPSLYNNLEMWDGSMGWLY